MPRKIEFKKQVLGNSNYNKEAIKKSFEVIMSNALKLAQKQKKTKICIAFAHPNAFLRPLSDIYKTKYKEMIEDTLMDLLKETKYKKIRFNKKIRDIITN